MKRSILAITMALVLFSYASAVAGIEDRIELAVSSMLYDSGEELVSLRPEIPRVALGFKATDHWTIIAAAEQLVATGVGQRLGSLQIGTIGGQYSLSLTKELSIYAGAGWMMPGFVQSHSFGEGIDMIASAKLNLAKIHIWDQHEMRIDPALGLWFGADFNIHENWTFGVGYRGARFGVNYKAKDDDCAADVRFGGQLKADALYAQVKFTF